MGDGELQQFFDSLVSGGQLTNKVVFSIFVIVITLLIRWVISRVIKRSVEDATRHYYWQMGVKYIIHTMGVILVARIWFEGVASITTFLGLVAAGLAIAMQDVIGSMISFAFIIWRRPFKAGDRIQLGSDVGDVVEVRLFQTLLMEVNSRWVDGENSTGRLLHVPNNRVFKERLINYEKGFSYIWYEIVVITTFESNWKRVKELLMKIMEEEVEPVTAEGAEQLHEISRRHLIRFGKLTPIVYLSTTESGIRFTMRFLVFPRAMRAIEDKIWTRVLEEFDENDDMDFAYPTTRFFFNQTEGKENARANFPRDFVPNFQKKSY